MKKFLEILFVLVFATLTSAVFAESWDDIPNLDRAWDGQKSITNKEFEQAMDLLQKKQKKREARKKKRKVRKISGGGTSLHPEMNPDNNTIPELQSLKVEPEGLLVNLPVHMIIDGKQLDKGYYNVIGERDNDKKIYINFYQSQYLKGKVEAYETDDDFGEQEVNFAKITGYSNSFVKLIFGSINFNAYAYIPYSE